MRAAMCAGAGGGRDGIADYSRHLAAGLRSNGVEADIVPLGFYINEKRYYKEAAMKAGKADLCHVQFNYVYFNGEMPGRNRFADFAGGLTVPMVVTLHEVRVGFQAAVSGFKNGAIRAAFNATLPFWNRWSRDMHKKIYARASRIIVHSAEHAGIVSSLVRDPGKTVLIPHGIPEVAGEAKALSSEDAKRGLGLSGKRVLAIFGFINQRKGYETALEALSGLPDDVVLLIAGGRMAENAVDTEYYRSLEELIDAKRLRERVRITGYLEEKETPVIMAASDICLAPFSSTAASGALSLCIAYNKAIVASDIPVHREINARVPCLELSGKGNPDELADKVKMLFDNKERAGALSLSTARYAGQYSYRGTAATTIKVYREALSGRPA